jgi:hypothetical protein
MRPEGQKFRVYFCVPRGLCGAYVPSALSFAYAVSYPESVTCHSEEPRSPDMEICCWPWGQGMVYDSIGYA